MALRTAIGLGGRGELSLTERQRELGVFIGAADTAALLRRGLIASD
jgi:hypothetical protein